MSGDRLVKCQYRDIQGGRDKRVNLKFYAAMAFVHAGKTFAYSFHIVDILIFNFRCSPCLF